jgi:hypothetical protein
MKFVGIVNVVAVYVLYLVAQQAPELYWLFRIDTISFCVCSGVS